MRQGLIAQWHQGIAARGLVGAMLLMIPVLVGATIGLGGVAGGLTSLATGPSETAVGGTTKTVTQGSAKNIERLSASLTASTFAVRTRNAGRNGGAGTGPKSAGAPLASSVSGGTDTSTGSGSSSSGSSPAATGTGSGSSVPPTSAPTSTPTQPTDLVTQLINGLLGQ
jgi:hypothetical protein